MSHNVVVVEFDDGLRLYAINDGTACILHPFLFLTHKDAVDWIFSGDRDSRLLPGMPEIAVKTDESVIIYPDEPWSFRSRASRSARWITGPCEKEFQETWDDQSVYGSHG